MANGQNAGHNGITRREIFSTILLSLATIASTWSAYQSSRWSGQQMTRFSEAGTTRTKSEGFANRAAQQASFDAGMFMQYAAALSRKDQKLAHFLYERFRPEMKVALDAWLATNPLQNPNAPASPFVMPEYSLETMRESRQLAGTADRKFEEARTANETSDSYVLLTVLFTVVLFFAGVGGKLWSREASLVLFILGIVIFVTATVALIMLPVL